MEILLLIRQETLNLHESVSEWMLEVSRELPPQFRLVSMITYFADVKFCRSLFINLARPCPPLCCPSEKLSMEFFPVIFRREFIQSWIFQQICNRIQYWNQNIGRQFSILAASQLQYYCRRIARFISVTSNLLLVKTAHISFLPLPLSLRFLLKLENIFQNF